MNNNKDKMIAKIIWNAMLVITIAAAILIVSSIGAMIEAMAFLEIPLIVSMACAVWFGLFALFVRWANN